jgi:outer membrane protein assembly factor BamD (BamD/ComL family)
MRTRKRLTKQQLKRDRFVDTTFDWIVWARENVRMVGLAAGGVVLLGLAFFLYRTSEAREAKQAAQKFQEVLQTYAAGNYQLAANDFKLFLRDHGSSRLGPEAALYLANSYLLAGDPQSAAKTLEDSRSRLEEGPAAFAAATLLGSAYEGAGDLAKAAEAYQRAYDEARYDFEKTEALMDKARVHVAQKAADKAIAAYTEVIQKYPESAAAREAKVRMAELTAKPLALSEAAAAATAAEVQSAAEPDSASAGLDSASATQAEPARAKSSDGTDDAVTVTPAATAGSEAR